ncbi:MAG: hypothetical protein HY428_02800 [Candidatus Levybacteria bacterium]|nr:hypothetical protein [Candidatus Levybacteria bacterium]
MKRDWDVLLIGGSAGTGKTTLARQLSHHFEIPYMEVDDIRLVMQNTLKKEDNPDLFALLTKDKAYFDTTPHEKIAEELVRIGTAVWPGLKTVIDNHLKFNNLPVILEGDGIIPDSVATGKHDRMKAIFLFDQKGGIYERELQREKEGHIRAWEVSGRDEKNLEAWRTRYASVSSLFGKTLKHQARRHGYVVFDSSTIETLYDRVVSAIK